MRLLFVGTPKIAIPTLDALAAAHQVVGVITRPDAPTGRGRKIAASAIAIRAEELGIPVFKPATAKETDLNPILYELMPDCCPVVAYGALLSEAVLQLPKHNWVNLHFSLLPQWRGAAPVQRAIINGDTIGGVTTFEIVKQLDAGPIYLKKQHPYGSDASAGQIFSELASLGAKAMLETMELIEQGIAPVSQPEKDVTVATKISVADAKINWNQNNKIVHNLVRAISPLPGAWTIFKEARLKILETKLADGNLPPGELKVEKHQVLVGTGNGCLALVKVQPQGKKVMSGADWGRGGIMSGMAFQ